MYFGSNDGHYGLGVNVLSRQSANGCTFVLTELQKQDGKYFVIHASVQQTISSSGRITGQQLLTWLGFQHFETCPTVPMGCFYKVIGKLDTRIEASAIQSNEFRRQTAEHWARHFDEILSHAQSLQSALRSVGSDLPNLK